MSSSPDWKIIRQKGWRDTNDRLVNSHFRFGSGKESFTTADPNGEPTLGGLMWACQESSWLGKCNEGQRVSFHGLSCIPRAGRLKQQACTVLQFRRPQVWTQGRFSFLWRLWQITAPQASFPASGGLRLSLACSRLSPSIFTSPPLCAWICPCTQIPSFKNTNCARYWMLGAGALGRPRGMEWGGRREEGSGWGTHVYLWWIHYDIWQN